MQNCVDHHEEHRQEKTQVQARGEIRVLGSVVNTEWLARQSTSAGCSRARPGQKQRRHPKGKGIEIARGSAGFLEILRDMLGDANPMVVANAVASLCEISTSARQNFLKLDEDVISRLLPALNQCLLRFPQNPATVRSLLGSSQDPTYMNRVPALLLLHFFNDGPVLPEEAYFLTDAFVWRIYDFSLKLKAKPSKIDEKDFEFEKTVVQLLQRQFAKMALATHMHTDIWDILQSFPADYHSGEQQDDILLLARAIAKESGIVPTIQKLLQERLKCEEMDDPTNLVVCEKCDKNTCSVKWSEITRPPPHLCLCLNRFTFSMQTDDFTKERTPVKIDEGLWMGGYEYELYHTIIHTGKDASSGHYYAMGRRSEPTPTGDCGWYTMDDSQIKELKKIIGMTITGASINLGLLKQIQPDVVIVEEAAEVLEPQILAVLGPWVKHLILIGDHRQLPPPVETYSLKLNHLFDTSMLERLIHNKLPSLGRLASSLRPGFASPRNVELIRQGRMLPSISKLLSPIYPFLRDNLKVVQRLKAPDFVNSEEWGQVFILDALALYDPPNSKVAEAILEKGVVATLHHHNSAVVLSAIKVIMKFMDRLSSQELVRSVCRKMTPPLLTMLSAEPEIQYVVMRNINLIVQKQPNMLQTDVRYFVCKYNDPLYVKLEKIAVMVQLASERNIDQVLSEFREYASEVDITVVRHSVRAIGQAAIKIDRAAERCVDCLLELIKTKVNYVVQEAIVVIRDIFRKYPGKYEIIISDLCENLDSLDEPDAKAAMIWIVGEYAERIDNSGELLESFLESFHEEPASVQHQILTATVKMFLKVPQSSKQLVGRVLKLCTDESTNPDLRDRGYMYWRMLSKSPEVAKQVVLSERPTISENPFALQPRVLDRLVANISTLASVYHQVPEAFCDNNRRGGTMEQEDDMEDYAETLAQVQEEIQQTAGKTYEEESGDEESEDSASSSASENGGGRPSGTAASGGGAAPPPLRPLAQVLSEQTRGQQGQTGLRVAAAVVRGNGGAVGMQLMVGNFSQQPMSGWAVQMNKNPFGLAPSGPLQLNVVPPNGTGKVLLPLSPNQLSSGSAPSNPLYLEVAIKTNVDVFYLNVGYDLSAVLVDDGPMPKEAFQRLWQSAPADKKAMCQGAFSQKVTADMVSTRMQQYYCFLVARTQAQDMDQMYFSCATSNKLNVYCELSLQRNGPGVRLICCSEQQVMVPLFQSFVSELLQVRWQQGGPPAPRG
eukprot:s2572_g11.t1